jgi:hypothetical protein
MAMRGGDCTEKPPARRPAARQLDADDLGAGLLVLVIDWMAFCAHRQPDGAKRVPSTTARAACRAPLAHVEPLLE